MMLLGRALVAAVCVCALGGHGLSFAGPLTVTQDGDHLWVENDYYKWDVSKGSQFIVKVGTNPRDWRAYPGKSPDETDYFVRVGRNEDYSCPVQFGAFGSHGQIIQQTPDVAILRFRDTLSGSGSILETTLTFYARASFIRLQYRVLDLCSTVPRGVEYALSLLPGGDKGAEDFVTWPGLNDGGGQQKDATWPFGTSTEIQDADIAAMPGSPWTYVAEYDKSVQQGLALLAHRTSLQRHCTDLCYGPAIFDDRSFQEAYSLMRLYVNSTLSTDLCLQVFTASNGTKWWESIKPPFDEATVRYILADLGLGGPVAYYRAKTDPNSVEAVSRWDRGIRAASIKFLERKEVPGIIVYKGTSDEINGNEVLLYSMDPDEACVRYIMADIALSGLIGYYRARSDDPNAKEAVARWDAGVRVTNASAFERREVTIPGNWTITYAGTDDFIDGMDVQLSTWVEMEVRYMLADIALGGPVDYYRNRTDSPDAMEAVRRYDAGVRCSNPQDYERKFVRGRGSWTITYAGTSKRIWGYNVQVTSVPPAIPIPGDISPVSDDGAYVGPNGHKYGDGKLDLTDAAYLLRVLSGLNTVP
jgi:hypothetical protein